MIVRSLYNTQRQMNVLQKKQENNSANIANVKTPGYKFQQLVQRTMEEYDVHNHAGSRHNDRLTTIGSINFGTEIDGAYTVFDQGNLESTGIYTDLALSGEGFFGVLTEDGQLGLTRNGNFITNEAGELVTQEGYQVLSVDPAGNTTPVVIEDDQFSVDRYGRINESDQRILTAGPGDGAYETVGETVYLPEGGAYVPLETQVQQGYVEMSNVDLADAMVTMMEVSREFESNQRVLRTINETLNKTVNEIGRNG